MLKLFLTHSKSSPEFVYKEYVPYFDGESQNSHTPCWIGTHYPELFTSTNVIPLDSTKNSKKALSQLTGVPLKYIASTLLQNQRISPDEKVYKQFQIQPEEDLVIQKATNFLKVLDKLKRARKIVTGEEIFVHFAGVHKIPCLAFYDSWNSNPYKSNHIRLYSNGCDGKTKLIDHFLAN